MSYRHQNSSKFSLSKTKIFLIFIVLATLLLGQFTYLFLGKFIPENLETLAQNQNTKLEIKGFKVSFPLKFSAHSLLAILPSNKALPANLNFKCLETRGQLKLLSLLGLNKSLSFNSKCYGGKVEGALKGKVFSNQYFLNYNAKDLALEQYPLLKLFNIKGKISSNGNLYTKEKSQEIDKFQGEVSLKEGNFPGGYGYGVPLPLPEITDIQIKCQILFNNAASRGKFSGVVELSQCKGKSSLLNITGQANGKIGNLNQLIQGKVDFKLELSEQGIKDIGGYLALASGEYSENPAKKWNIFLEKKLNGQIVNNIKPIN